MKTFRIAASLAISVAFLSCSTSEPGPGSGSPRCKIAAKQGYEEVPSFIKEFDGYKDIEKLDPSCKSEGKEFFYVYDTVTINPPDLDKRIYECQESKTYLDEAIGCKDEAMKYWDDWRAEHKRRDLPIPCVVYEGAVNWWGALLTAEEVTELEETYGVNIYGQSEYLSSDSGGGNDAIPPTMAIDEKRCGE